ncbi:MAG: hypothetical protein LBM01_00155 [Christensenellaceae bacterium]|jgi:hypothetical protein|nr:hypothetical protein [Christensenellaceae bacterium]
MKLKNISPIIVASAIFALTPAEADAQNYANEFTREFGATQISANEYAKMDIWRDGSRGFSITKWVDDGNGKPSSKDRCITYWYIISNDKLMVRTDNTHYNEENRMMINDGNPTFNSYKNDTEEYQRAFNMFEKSKGSAQQVPPLNDIINELPM